MESNALAENASVAVAAWIGLDWASKQHQWYLRQADGVIVEGKVANEPEAILGWLEELTRLLPEGCIRVLLERKTGALVHWLAGHPRVEIYVVHPLSLKDYRRARRPSGAKDDPHDAMLLEEFLRLHSNAVELVEPGKGDYAALDKLVRARRRMVNERTRAGNRLRDELAMAFPQALGWWKDLTTPAAARLLARWPTLDAMRKASAAVKRFLRTEMHWNEEQNAAWATEFKQASGPNLGKVLLRAAELQVQALARQLVCVGESIALYDKEIAALAKQQADYAIFDSLDGAGPALVPRLMVLFGEDREAWGAAYNLQCLSGVAPITEASGRSQRVRRRVACPKFLRQTMVEFARCSVRKSTWAREYFEQRKARGMGKPAIYRALAYKWLRIIFRCWKDRVKYEEARYLISRAKRSGQHAPEAAEKGRTVAVEMVLKSCGDFMRPALP